MSALFRLARTVLAACALSAWLSLPAQAEKKLLKLPDGKEVGYTLLDRGSQLPSALPTASRILTYLAHGRIEDAARLSNAPERRREVLEEYRARVGDAEFRRIYARYLEPENRVSAEIAIGPHRLLVWTLGEADDAIVGQYYIEIDGRFVMDDVPSAARRDLRRVLDEYRRKAKPAPKPAPKPASKPSTRRE